MDREIELHIGEQRVPLNIFARQVILGGVLGMLGALKGVELKQEISIKIGPAKA